MCWVPLAWSAAPQRSRLLLRLNPETGRRKMTLTPWGLIPAGSLFCLLSQGVLEVRVPLCRDACVTIAFACIRMHMQVQGAGRKGVTVSR